jgi:hypothetical protein
MERPQGSRQVDGSKLEDAGHSRSGVNVVDSKRVRDAIGYFEGDEGHSRIRRIGFTVLTVWCLASTGIAMMTYSTVIELEQIITKMNQEVVAAADKLKE